jgi:hypothetical protein
MHLGPRASHPLKYSSLLLGLSVGLSDKEISSTTQSFSAKYAGYAEGEMQAENVEFLDDILKIIDGWYLSSSQQILSIFY